MILVFYLFTIFIFKNKNYIYFPIKVGFIKLGDKCDLHIYDLLVLIERQTKGVNNMPFYITILMYMGTLTQERIFKNMRIKTELRSQENSHKVHEIRCNPYGGMSSSYRNDPTTPRDLM